MLKIGIIGASYKQSIDGLNYICSISNDIFRNSRERAYEQNAEYIAFYPPVTRRGYKLDQVFLCGEIFLIPDDVLDLIEHNCLITSCVPKEFMIQFIH